MSQNPTAAAPSHVAPQRPLGFMYPFYKDMFDNNIIFSYRGVVTSDLVTNVLEIMEERMEGQGQSRKLTKKVFNVMVECLTNVYVDEDKARAERARDVFYDPSALLMVKRVNDAYRVTTGNLVPTHSVNAIKKMIDKINNMDHDELKNYYQEVLCMEETNSQGLSHLAIIDLARKSRNKLMYSFKFESDAFTFFSLESEISKSSL